MEKRALELTPAYLQSSLGPQLELFKAGGFARAVEEFIASRVRGVQVNGVDVIGVDLRHSERRLHSYVLPLIYSPRTTGVVAEYFGPDIHGNRERRERLARLTDSLVPSGDSSAARLAVADHIADVCAGAEKPVIVTDIANRPGRYFAAEHGFRLAPAVPGIYEGSMRQIDNIIPAVNDVFPAVRPDWAAYVSGALAAWEIAAVVQEKLRRGMFNPNGVSKAERWYPDMTHARRMFAASEIERLTTDPRFATSPDEAPAQLLVFDPQAHLLRIQDMLLEPQRGWNRLRGGIYITVGTVTGLDLSARQWEYNNGWHVTRRPLAA